MASNTGNEATDRDNGESSNSNDVIQTPSTHPQQGQDLGDATTLPAAVTGNSKFRTDPHSLAHHTVASTMAEPAHCHRMWLAISCNKLVNELIYEQLGRTPPRELGGDNDNNPLGDYFKEEGRKWDADKVVEGLRLKDWKKLDLNAPHKTVETVAADEPQDRVFIVMSFATQVTNIGYGRNSYVTTISVWDKNTNVRCCTVVTMTLENRILCHAGPILKL